MKPGNIELIIIPLLLFLAASQTAAVTLTVTPSVTSNTYSGLITLQISGLSTGGTAVVQRYLDLNGNGVIDPGEPLVDTFPLKDGGASVIGGITNVSVPYDQNPASGVITTTLNFNLPMNFENTTATNIYQVVNTNGSFTPVTALFIVTNAPQNQTVSGTVYRSGAPAANVMVAADGQPSGGLAAAAFSDSTGHYNLPLPAGSYQILALGTNCFIDRSLAPIVNLTNGMSSVNNVFMTNGMVALGGQVYDATNRSGLGGVLLILQSGNYLAAVFTSSNGAFSTAVNSGFWTPAPEQIRLARRGYVVPETYPQINTTTGAVTAAGIALPKGNALFYGHIVDGSDRPVFNVDFDANDGNGAPSQYDVRGFSGTNGFYGVAVLANGNQWYTAPDPIENVQLANDIVSQGQAQPISAGQAIEMDFGVLPANAVITGRVVDNNGNPVVGVEMGATAMIGGDYYQSSGQDTDTNGDYTLSVASGGWSVQFVATSNNNENLANHDLEDLFGPYGVSIPPTNAVQNIVVYPIGVAVLANEEVSYPGEFDMNVYGELNVNYTLESSTDLMNWTPLYSFQLTSNPFMVSDYSATNPATFYRVELDQ